MRKCNMCEDIRILCNDCPYETAPLVMHELGLSVGPKQTEWLMNFEVDPKI